MDLAPCPDTLHYALADCFLGIFLISQSNNGINALFLGENPEELIQELADNFPKKRLICQTQNSKKFLKRITASIERLDYCWELPLDIQGTPFQKRVWDILYTIPLGTSISYSALAQRLGAPKAVRAVANACGANKISLIIPCHRVISSNGLLGGYRWGIERKKILLNSEKQFLKRTV